MADIDPVKIELSFQISCKEVTVLVPLSILIEHRLILVSMLYNPTLQKWEAVQSFNAQKYSL